MRALAVLSLSVLLFSCTGVPKREPVVLSLLGRSFAEPDRSPAAQAKLDSNLNVARERWEAEPNEENYVWYGRRLGYLSRFQEAVDVFSKGIEKYPNSAQLYRHRGHRYISMRKFDSAVADFEKAATLIVPDPLETEPDGAPNKLNIPLSSTQFNIWYHLGLAHYLKGDFAKAEQAYDSCLLKCNNDDLIVATMDWMYMTCRRQGKNEEALALLENITGSMNIVENDSYYSRCRMYQGKISPDSLLLVMAGDDDRDLTLATQGYGVGNWYLCQGDSAKAKKIFEDVVAGKHFSSFGFIAAEAELARWKK